MILWRTLGMRQARSLSQIQGCSGCFSGPKTMVSVHVHLRGALTCLQLVHLEIRTAPGCSSQKQWDMSGLNTLSMCFVGIQFGRGAHHGGSSYQVLSYNGPCSQHPGGSCSRPRPTPRSSITNSASPPMLKRTSTYPRDGNPHPQHHLLNLC